jgi:hypothetical protein
VTARGVDSSTFADETDMRPTILALTGLEDDYQSDGRVRDVGGGHAQTRQRSAASRGWGSQKTIRRDGSRSLHGVRREVPVAVDGA